VLTTFSPLPEPSTGLLLCFSTLGLLVRERCGRQ